jgi:hypothetical protein
MKSEANKSEATPPVGSGTVLACPYCGEPDYDLVGLKSHLLKGECEPFEAIALIRSPFDGLMTRQANSKI